MVPSHSEVDEKRRSSLEGLVDKDPRCPSESQLLGTELLQRTAKFAKRIPTWLATNHGTSDQEHVHEAEIDRRRYLELWLKPSLGVCERTTSVACFELGGV